MEFVIRNPPAKRLLATLDEDVVRDRSGEKPLATYTRIAASGVEVSIGSETAELPLPAEVTIQGVAP